MKPNKDTGAKWAKVLPGLLFTVLFGAAALVFAWKIADHLIDERTSLDYWEGLQDAVIIMDPEGQDQDGEAENSPAPDGPEPDGAPPETGQPPGEAEIPAAIDFDRLREISGDAVAWLFAPGTNINYVIAQADNNDYYLRRLLNGRYASGGSLFMDYRCAADFSDWNTVIYGHQMNNGTMFGELANYRDPAYYEAHPVMYLYVPGKRYTLELIAAYTTGTDDIVYILPATRLLWNEILYQADRESSFDPGVRPGRDDKLVTLSTCAYDFDNARYVVIGRLVED